MSPKYYREDRKLVTFLKQHRPLPPPQEPGWEDQLRNSIQREEQLSAVKSRPRFWVLPVAIAAGLLALIGGVYLRQPLDGQLADQSEDLEAFMVDSWQDSMADHHSLDGLYHTETQLILSQP